ncbi:ras association domain-containing protein 9-like [Pristis pectinata]|uniref:ras association domain-containing protein 9-like n=1 Tax=Pristis pectinata TaxID=685728 RepID=UPI00223D2A3C|nr:ras association domain-containing protein 9-like [Pristis pectinata]
MASPEGAEIAVWVCQEEKLVCGLTKRTSCAQVVRALLEDHLANAGATRLLHAPAKDYCIVEKWRGFERLLPPATKLLRLWASWGEEQPNVHFVLVKAGASLAVPGLRSAEAKVIQNKGGQGELSAAQYINSLPAEKQKRMVRKAFRKLAKMKKLKQGREGIETLVHLILSQDHTIRQQLQRMRELDAEIDRYESWTHLERIQKEGENYVQETYLLESREGGGQVGERGQLQEYLSRRDATFQLQEQIEQHGEAIERLSAEIQLEMTRLCGADPGKAQGAPGSPSIGQSGRLAETERMQSELEAVMCIALQLHQDLSEVQEKVKREELVLSQKAAECEHLVEQLQSLHLAEGGESDTPVSGPAKAANKCVLPLKSVKAPPKSCSEHPSPSDVNDTDSDTGISSTHSQDSEPSCVEVVTASTDYL